MAIGPVPMENDSQFRIAATEGIREPRTRILKHGNTFAVLNNFGDMTAEPGGLGSRPHILESRVQQRRTTSTSVEQNNVSRKSVEPMEQGCRNE